MARFHELEVKDVREETSDTVSVAFNVPEELSDAFSFIQGQYITLRAEINGEDVRRSYSICSAPKEGELRVAIKKVDGGKFSTYANEELKAGDVLKVMTPQGRFHTELDQNNTKHYVAFAAGSGITPVMSIMKSVLTEEPKSNFTLFYGNKNTGSIIFKEDIEDLKNAYVDRLSVYHVLSRENPGADLFYGRIDEEKCGRFCQMLFDPAGVDEYFLCGPEAMIKLVTNELEAQKVDKKKIHYELFTSPDQPNAAQHATSRKKWKSTGEKVDSAEVKVIVDGEESIINIASDGDSILDAALKAGVDVPFACKGAVCMTCRGKILEGDAEMEKNYALLDEEVEQGYILTCQSHPRSKNVTVSFDE